MSEVSKSQGDTPAEKKRRTTPNPDGLSPRELALKNGYWPKGVYCEETATEILRRMADGEQLRPICREPGMPSHSVFYDWLNEVEGLELRFARARTMGYDAIASETLEIADDGRNDYMERFNEQGLPIGWVLNGEHVQRSKLRIETRLKILAKWDPKRYGDRLTLDGKMETPPDQVTTQLVGMLSQLAKRTQPKDDNS